LRKRATWTRDAEGSKAVGVVPAGRSRVQICTGGGDEGGATTDFALLCFGVEPSLCDGPSAAVIDASGPLAGCGEAGLPGDSGGGGGEYICGDARASAFFCSAGSM